MFHLVENVAGRSSGGLKHLIMNFEEEEDKKMMLCMHLSLRGQKFEHSPEPYMMLRSKEYID